MTSIYIERGTYYLPEDAAVELGVTPGRIYQLISAGTLEAIQVAGRCYLIPDHAIANRKKSNPGPGRKSPKSIT